LNHPFTSARNPVFFIAEVGGNHEGSVESAHALNDLAIASGADAVKYQLYTGDTLVSPVESPDRNAHFKRFEIGLDTYDELAQACRRGGVDFMASTWDFGMVDWVNERVRMHKVGSGDLTCVSMLRRLAQTRKPIILSTGLSTLDEVSAAVDCIIAVDGAYLSERKLAILQCTSSYPCPDEDANLRVLETLKARFPLPIGFSDHTLGSVAVEAAVALGAEIIEKHFTDSRDGKTFRDHSVSLTAQEIRELMPRLTRIKALRGSDVKTPTPAELRQNHVVSFRRAVYASRDLPAGTVLDESCLTVLRPMHGISASRIDSVEGKTLKNARRAFDVLRDEDLA
jgi:N,N'-diacetyllegionaminate synthase